MKLRASSIGLLSCLMVSPAQAEFLSSFGTPGLIDLPSAEVLNDGELALTTSTTGATTKNTFTFQMLPRVYGTFRYGTIREFDLGVGNGNRYDRSFDLHFQIAEERQNRPAVAIGLRDFGGTGIYSSEYLAATKTFGNRLTVTGGLGWGRLAERGGFDNPLGAISDYFDDRPNVSAGGINTTGQLDFGSWFRGDAAFFGGARWQVNDRMSVVLEYSPDLYSRETDRGLANIKTPINAGVNYKFRNGVGLSAYVVGGNEIGAQLSYVLDPAKRRIPGGLEQAPQVLVPRESLAAASWNLADAGQSDQNLSQVLQSRLEAEGLRLEGVVVSSNSAHIRVENNRWGVEAQAAGRAARVLANTLPPEIETLEVIFLHKGVPITSVKTQRSDLYELENDYDGAWRSQSRAQIQDANVRSDEFLADAYPRFDWGLNPFLSLSYFDPDNPVRYEVGAELSAGYQPTAGLTFSTTLRYPLAGNIATATRRSNSGLQRVRSDGVLYAAASDLEIRDLTAEYLFRPGQDLFGRVTAGYLEQMYGGLSAELLWFPVDSKLAIGGEVSYVKQRDYDQLFGFRSYSVATGHVSGYYDMGNGFHAQIDAGRYLAGDWGATFALDREFNNGWKVGAYFTLTDVPFEEFGEGSFDKGIRFEIPISWISGKPSRDVTGQVIQPVVRDGGARLFVKNRLYGVTRDYRSNQLHNGWGRYFR